MVFFFFLLCVNYRVGFIYFVEVLGLVFCLCLFLEGNGVKYVLRMEGINLFGIYLMLQRILSFREIFSSLLFVVISWKWVFFSLVKNRLGFQMEFNMDGFRFRELSGYLLQVSRGSFYCCRRKMLILQFYSQEIRRRSQVRFWDVYFWRFLVFSVSVF